MTNGSSPGDGRLSWIAGAAVVVGMMAIHGAAGDDDVRQPDPSTLDGSLMTGYQGWFTAPGDGNDLGWKHYGFDGRGRSLIDLWPDLSEFGEGERFDTPLRHADGRPAQVFSSSHPDTVRRHFEWMRRHDIDGVFLQRFGVSLKNPALRRFRDRVLAEVRASARETGRTWAMMYDLSGLREGEIESVLMEDWKRLRNELRIADDPTYQHHNGRPVVAVWGIGFYDDRDYTLEECRELLLFLRDNPDYGGFSVMVGVPYGWRTLDRDAVQDEKLHEVIALADVVSPWAVGRYGSVDEALREIAEVQERDLDWCREREIDYMPVIFPGFSWRNLMRSRGIEAELNQVPRLGGEFLWRQAEARIEGGSRMLYVAMFDELDEATAIMPTASDVPAGPARFVTEPELDSHHYLRLTGRIAAALRGELELDEVWPVPDAPDAPGR